MTITSSNGYTWNADETLKKIIDQRNQTKVVFMNGILTSNFNQVKDEVDKALNLTNSVNSIKFNPVPNPSSETDGGNKGLEKAYEGLYDTLVRTVFLPALNKWNTTVSFASPEWFQYIAFLMLMRYNALQVHQF
jgi:hypothetical protein